MKKGVCDVFVVLKPCHLGEALNKMTEGLAEGIGPIMRGSKEYNPRGRFENFSGMASSLIVYTRLAKKLFDDDAPQAMDDKKQMSLRCFSPLTFQSDQAIMRNVSDGSLISLTKDPILDVAVISKRQDSCIRDGRRKKVARPVNGFAIALSRGLEGEQPSSFGLRL